MYINYQTFKKGLMLSLLAGSTAFISCKKDKNEPENPPVAEKEFLIDAKGTDKSFELYVSNLEKCLSVLTSKNCPKQVIFGLLVKIQR